MDGYCAEGTYEYICYAMLLVHIILAIVVVQYMDSIISAI